MNSQTSVASDIFNNGYYRGLAARLEYAAGFDVPLDIAWQSFGDADSDTLHDDLLKIFFEPLIKAFQTTKSAGPDDLEWKLKKVVLQAQKNSGASFANGQLTIDFALASDPNAVDHRAALILKALQKK